MTPASANPLGDEDVSGGGQQSVLVAVPCEDGDLPGECEADGLALFGDEVGTGPAARPAAPGIQVERRG